MSLITDIEQIYNTSFGRFKVSINTMSSLDLMTREKIIISYTVNIGGGKNKCVQIKVPNDKSNNTAELLIVKTSLSDCEVNGIIIKKEKTIKMVLLGFTILRDNFPHIQLIKLQDKSSFECKFANDSRSGISLTLYEFLFHQHTWYDRHFNAELINKDLQKIYTTSITNNFRDKSFKPLIFDFNNSVLNEKLIHIYNNSDTWKDFLDKIYKLNSLCEVIFPWYKYASSIILDNINLDGQWWLIKLNDNNKIYPIKYTIGYSKGGFNKTIKNKNSYNNMQYDEFIYNNPSYDEIYNYKYTNINFNKLYK